MKKKIEKKASLVTSAIISALFVIGGIAGTIYFGYPMWSWVGFGVGIFLGDWFAWKKFGPGKSSDNFLDVGLFFALAFGFYWFVLPLIIAADPYITRATIETIEAIAFLIIGAVTFPTVRYFRTRKQK